VISTQVVEAGVDLDFPIVFREFGPLDRMVQAAGRCNRNGIPGQAPFGRTCIFRIAGATAPPGEYSLAIQAAQTKIAEGRDLQDPETYESFFRLFYRDLADTGQCIQKRRLCFDYPEVASLYRMIDDDTVPLLIESEVLRHKKAADVFRSVNVKGFATRADWRALQQFAVSVRAKEVGRRFPETDIQREWIPGLHLWKGYYHPRLGLGETIEMAIEDLITGG
jgi:CRISPR-associated endonuclease/helicase Cas3